MGFFAELRRRNVIRVGIAYAIVAWLVAQVAALALDSFGAPNWVMKSLLFLLVVGFPLALIFAWAFELTPQGIKFDAVGIQAKTGSEASNRRLDYLIISTLSLILAFVIIDKYVLEDNPLIAEIVERRQSIAVLPFANRSVAEENAAFFADGIHDELLTRLAKIKNLRVTSRTSVMQYRDTTRKMHQIGADLGVGSVLEGEVQRAGDNLRINVQLIDVDTDKHLWAESYESELTAVNIFAIQGEIATAIANALRVTLSAEEELRIRAVPTENFKALEAYFLGQQMVDRRDAEPIASAITYFQLATELEPHFALAYAGLAEAWLQVPTDAPNFDAVQAQSRASEAAQKALELDAELPDALAVQAWQRLLHHYDWDGAAKQFVRALEIEPSNGNALHWYSHLLSWQGKYDAAIELSKRALVADPLSTLMQVHLCGVYVQARRFDEAFTLGEDILERDTYPLLMRIMISGFLRAGRGEDASEMLITWASATGRDAEAAIDLGDAIVRYQQTGEPVALREDLFERLQMIEVVAAWIYAFVGDKEMAISMLQRAHDGRFGQIGLMDLKFNPLFDILHDDPRFIELMTQIGPPD